MHRLLDLYCKAGGAGWGYGLAGFEVTGVDKDPQPRYPFEFRQYDVTAITPRQWRDIARRFDAVHASPPCHDHTPLVALSGPDQTGPLLGYTRARLATLGIPWVIENVPGAPMRADVTLCGHMFQLRTRRHRLFELSGFSCTAPPHVHRDVRTATTRRRERWLAGWDISVTGDVGVYCGPGAMGIDWMTGNELSQAIPPAYTEFIGWALREALGN
jgi:DNA (cytosine-5)-methyltransferase 1